MAKKSVEEQNKALRTYVRMLKEQIERHKRFSEAQDGHIQSLKNWNDYMKEALEVREKQILMLQEALQRVTDEGMKMALAALPDDFFSAEN